MSLPRPFTLLPLVLALFTGCTSSSPPGPSATGAMRLAIQLPEALPADVSRVTVTVSGSDMASRATDLSLSNGAWGGVLGELPAGAHRTFLAQAFTPSNTLRYQGQASDVTVTAGATSLLTLNLQDLTTPPPLSNEAPIVDALTASATTVVPGGTLTLNASVHDPNAGDSLTYSWSASAGSFSAPTQASTTWTAPSTPRQVYFSLRVTDSHGVTVLVSLQLSVSWGLGGAEVTVDFITTPTVETFTSSQSSLDVGQQTALAVSATDTAGGDLSYQWSATCAGSFTSTTTSSTTFTPSARPTGACNNCQVRVVVANARGGQTQASLELCVAPPVGINAGWNPTGAMALSRAQYQLLTLPDGKALTVGGFIPQTELYDPATGLWSPTGSMSSTYGLAAAILLKDGRVLASGNMSTPLELAEVYDPATGLWSSTGSMGTARQEHAAARLADGRVLVSGGHLYGTSMATAEVYDPATGLWSPTGSMASPRNGHTLTPLPDGKVLAVGGQTSGAAPPVTAEVYDPATGTWSPTGTMHFWRYSHTATPLPGGKVLVTSGLGDGGDTSAEVYDPATGTWSLTGPLSISRLWHAAVALSSGRVLVSGGYGPSDILATAEVYDPTTNAWSPIDAMSRARCFHAMTLLTNGQVLVSGGFSYDSGPDLAELYTP